MYDRTEMKEIFSYHLQPLLHRRRSFQILRRRFHVELHALLAQIDHVAAEQGLAVFLVVLLVRIHHAVEPRKQLLGAVVRVQHHGDAICGRNGTDVVGTSNGAGNGPFLTAIGGGLEMETGCD